MFVGAEVTVGTTPTVIATGDTDQGGSVSLLNASAVNITIGGSTVAVGAGYLWAPGVPLNADLERGEMLYGIVASGTALVYSLMEGV